VRGGERRKRGERGVESVRSSEFSAERGMGEGKSDVYVSQEETLVWESSERETPGWDEWVGRVFPQSFGYVLTSRIPSRISEEAYNYPLCSAGDTSGGRLRRRHSFHASPRNSLGPERFYDDHDIEWAASSLQKMTLSADVEFSQEPYPLSAPVATSTHSGNQRRGHRVWYSEDLSKAPGFPGASGAGKRGKPDANVAGVDKDGKKKPKPVKK